MAQSVTGAWDALYAALQTLFANQQSTLVCAGEPGEFQPDLVISMMGIDAPITQPTMGTNRSRDKHCTFHVVVSAYVRGGPEAQQPANQMAWAAADSIESYFRTSPNERLGGAAYHAFAEITVMVPSISWEQVDGESNPVPAARIAEIALAISVWIRI